MRKRYRLESKLGIMYGWFHSETSAMQSAIANHLMGPGPMFYSVEITLATL